MASLLGDGCGWLVNLLARGRAVLAKYPVNPGLWYPGGTMTTNRFVHEARVLLLQVIPALIIDLILFIFGQKTFMMRVQKKIRVGCEVLEYFTMRTWNVSIDQTLNLLDYVSEEEQKIFYLANVAINIDDVMKNSILGTKMYCLNEPLDTLPAARNRLMIYWIVDKLFQGFLLYYICGWLYSSYLFLVDVDSKLQALPVN